MAIEIGIFHNGASDLPAKETDNGVVVNDGATPPFETPAVFQLLNS